MENLKLTIKNEEIAYLEWDQLNSSVNLLTLTFLEELSSLLKELEQKKIKVLIFTSKKPRVFCAGADIKEFKKKRSKEEVLQTLDTIHDFSLKFEQLKFSKIAVIEGLCLGGGLEWALCFDYRLAGDSKTTKLALPEVHLGFIPVFGGTLRLARLIGLRQSLKIILTGATIPSQEALDIGLLDAVIPSLVLEKFALELAKDIVKGEKLAHPKKSYKKLKPYSFLLEKLFKSFICFSAKKHILKKTKGFYHAPLKALKHCKKTYAHPINKDTLNLEKQVFYELYQSSQCKNLIKCFTLLDQAKKQFHILSNTTKQIERIGIVGAGVMGRSIAYSLANKGFKVRLVDISEQALTQSLIETEQLWNKQLQKKQINSYELTQKMCNLSVGLDFSGFSTLDLVIEALPENKILKQELLQKLSKKTSALIATNTSSLLISDLAKNISSPNRFFGLHFFNPVYKMPLVEVCLTKTQKDQLLTPVLQFLKNLEKIPLLVKDSPGFVLNRLLASYLSEALLLFEQGYKITDIDYHYRDKFGYPLGPFQLMDKIGLNLCIEVLSHLKNSGLDMETPKWFKDMSHILNEGENNKSSFYIYKNNKSQINENTKKLQKCKNFIYDEEEIIKRGLYRMINEGKKLIQNKQVSKEEDIDLALILGMGFPPFLGGLMSYAKDIGLSQIKKEMLDLSNKYGKRFKPVF